MICIESEMLQEISSFDDELKAIYHNKTVYIWVFDIRTYRNKFMDELKNNREMHFESLYNYKS